MKARLSGKFGTHTCLHLRSDYVFKSFLGSRGPSQLWCADTCSTLHTPHTFVFLDTRKALGLKVFKQTNVCSVSLCRHGDGFVDVLPPSREGSGQCTASAAAPALQSLFTLRLVHEPGQHLCLFHRSPGMKAVV